MVVHRRKKVEKRRGSRTHGWGSPKKHRGKGSRGGKGKAGGGKKGQQKLSKIYAYGLERIGKHGFVPKIRKVEKEINLRDLELMTESLIEKKIAKKTGNVVELDVGELGYTKVLGSGKIKTKFKIKAKRFSANAIEKIKQAGGEAIATGVKKEKKIKAEKERKTKREASGENEERKEEFEDADEEG